MVIVAVGLPARQQLVAYPPVAESVAQASNSAEAGSDKPPLRKDSDAVASGLPNQFGALKRCNIL